MRIPNNIFANADDFGLNSSVNEAIIYCFENGYINSTSLLTNTAYFEETASLIHSNKFINNIGLHINLATDKPVTNFNQPDYLDENGNWDKQQTDKKINSLNREAKAAFLKEIYAQIDKALSAKIAIVHLDSHYHLHTLPCFYKLFLQAAKKYNLKLRLAQTYSEGNFIKFYYRRYINGVIKKSNINYADHFETVNRFLKAPGALNRQDITEIMLHPDMDASGKLTDHYDKATMADWLAFLRQPA